MDEEKKLIGGSLSKCIFDIVAGNVGMAKVEKIVAGTRARDADAWKKVVNAYAEDAWASKGEEFARKCVETANALYNEGKIEQPRLSQGGRSPEDEFDRTASHWFDAVSKEPAFVDSAKHTAATVEGMRLFAKIIGKPAP